MIKKTPKLLLLHFERVTILPLLYDGGKLTDALSLLAEDILCAGGLDDDLSADGGYSDLDAGITILSELTRQKL